MPYPPLPIEHSLDKSKFTQPQAQALYTITQNLHAIYLYLEHLRDLSYDVILSTVQSNPVTVTTIVASTFQNTATISTVYNTGPPITISFDLNDLSVTEAKLGNLSISNSKLQLLSIATGNIQDLAISTPKLADLCVTSAKLAIDSVITTRILNANVTYAKIQNVAASRLLGNPTGASTSVSEISLGTGLTFSGTSLNSSTQYSRVSTQFDKTTDTTLANVTGLTATLIASGIYKFRAELYVDASLVGGSKYAIAGTCTATGIKYEVILVDNTTNALTITSRQTALAGSVGQAGTTVGFCTVQGEINVANAGTLTVQFAQNAANATSSVLTESTFIVERIS